MDRLAVICAPGLRADLRTSFVHVVAPGRTAGKALVRVTASVALTRGALAVATVCVATKALAKVLKPCVSVTTLSTKRDAAHGRRPSLARKMGEVPSLFVEVATERSARKVHAVAPGPAARQVAVGIAAGVALARGTFAVATVCIATKALAAVLESGVEVAFASAQGSAGRGGAATLACKVGQVALLPVQIATQVYGTHAAARLCGARLCALRKKDEGKFLVATDASGADT